MEIRKQINVSGIVQGVGFRPFVYRLARSQSLTGSIRNTSAGVSIEIQGIPPAVANFVQRLSSEAPPLARITGISVRETPCSEDADFRIESSGETTEMNTLISPDVAICNDCLRELLHPTNRRYRYPFINCTNCGPRFTIVRDIPYDRARTSMSIFTMCAACQAEYDNPLDRRFHAQPNACWDCGPRLELWDNSGAIVPGDPIARAAEALQIGNIVAVKGLGGFHLAADAMNPGAVLALRERKHRVEKPLAVMVASVDAAYELCEIGAAERRTLQSTQRPIVLLRRRPLCDIPQEVAPSYRELGVFLPYTPLHHLLFEEGGFRALIMTSGNLSEEPIAIDNSEALQRLQGIADYFLVHNRDILLRCDDSVVRVDDGKVRQLRRSRGFVPVPVFLTNDQPAILAVGGELKNSICLTKGRHAFLSQHIGDLENAESYKFFEEAVTHLENTLEIEPDALAYDLHPGYFSTKWALQQTGPPIIGVQHHHAHIASCMAENHLDGRVIGFAFDGTGYGTDGKIWGGEVLLAGYDGFERFAHFEYVPMPGGAAAIREPWRMAVSYLAHHFGPGFLNFPVAFVRQLDRKKTDTLLQMMKQGVNSPLTSSCGRLFDAVAALIGIRQKVNYEAQAAIELEFAASDSGDAGKYPLILTDAGDTWMIGTRPLFEGITADLKDDLPPAVISRRFHNSLIDLLQYLARTARKKSGLARVCLSGGTFNNRSLQHGLTSKLAAAGFEVFTHHEVPAGDGGLPLGQAVIAGYRRSR